MSENRLYEKARDMRKDYAMRNKVSDIQRQRMWLLLKTGVERKSIKIEVDGEMKTITTFAEFAEKVLGIKPNSLSRKLTGKDRYFNSYEVEIFTNIFGEDAMNYEKYDIINGRPVEKNRDEN